MQMRNGAENMNEDRAKGYSPLEKKGNTNILKPMILLSQRKEFPIFDLSPNLEGMLNMSWMNRCYSRLLVDNHISDMRPEYMSKYSSAEYVKMARLSGAESVMLYACDHNGNCYYPTQAGHMHAGLKGHDIFGEGVAGLRKEGIVPVAYYTLIYHNDAARLMPECRTRDISGADHGGRYHYCCPNAPGTVEFHSAQIGEILQYPVEGIFLDMTFWPCVCLCDSCRKKFREETGFEIPEIIDWSSRKWISFQRFRERSMVKFAVRLTEFIRSLRPDITVAHQFSPVMHGWYLGQSAGIAAASDYASGDFYGGKLQQRFAVKAFDAYSVRKPFEFMTSRCVTLRDHTSTKSDDELYLHALTTLANGGAYFFIDAINPDGTFEERFYRRLEALDKRLAPFRKVLEKYRPQLIAEVGIYFSMASCVDNSVNGFHLRDVDENKGNMDIRRNAVLDEALGTAEILLKMHVPFRIVTDSATDFSGLKAVIVLNAAYLSKEETGRLRAFASDGGTLIATGNTSFYDLDGNTSGDFALADVFGVIHTGTYAPAVHYLVTGNETISAEGQAAPLVRTDSARVLGGTAFPDFPLNDPERYASIHSNPPGKISEYPGLTVHHYGRGRCVYLYSPVLRLRQHSQQEFGRKLFSKYLPMLADGTENLHPATELTLMKSGSETLLIGLVNYQDDLPPVPLHDIVLRVRLPEGFIPGSVTRVSDDASIAFKFKGARIEIKIPVLEYGEFFLLKI